jgi:glutamate dehydrogenase
VGVAYFPTALHERCGPILPHHPLRREIVATVVVNDLVNDAGISFVHRLREETAAPCVDIVRAYLVARGAFDLEVYREQVAALDNLVAADVGTGMRLSARRLAERATRWLLAKRRSPLDIGAELELFSDAVTEVLELLPDTVRGPDAEAFRSSRDLLLAAGVGKELAERAAALELAFTALDIVEVARSSGRELAEVAAVYFLLADELDISVLRAMVTALPRDDRWKAMARASLREDLSAAHAALTAEVLAAGEPTDSAQAHLAAWRETAGEVLTRAAAVFTEIAAGSDTDLAAASVALRAFRGLLGSRLI